MMRRIVVECMDWRLDQKTDDEYNDGETIILRGAGPFVKDLMPSIKKAILAPENDINEMVLVTHNDCGAMKVIYGVLAGEMDAKDTSIGNRVEFFRDIKVRGRDREEVLAELEARNRELQEASLKVFESMGKGHKIEIKSENVEVEKHPGEYKKRVIVMPPTTQKYEEITKARNIPMMGTYFIQAYTISEVKTDIDMGRKLKIQDITIWGNKTKNTL